MAIGLFIWMWIPGIIQSMTHIRQNTEYGSTGSHRITHNGAGLRLIERVMSAFISTPKWLNGKLGIGNRK